MQHSTTQKRSSKGDSCTLLLKFVTAAMLIFSACSIRTAADETQAASAAVLQRSNVQTAIAAYHDRHGAFKSTWWIETSLISEDEVALRAYLDKSASLVKKVAGIVAKHRKLTPLAGRIAETYPSYRPSIFTGLVSYTIYEGTDTEPMPGLELCLIPRDQIVRMPSLAYYRAEWEALMIAAIEWPDQVLAGLVMHELGHALAQRDGLQSAVSAPTSDEYAREEMEMHNLEASVFNAESGGKYFAETDAIIARCGAKTFRDVIHGLTAADLERLDTAIGAEKSDSALSGLLLAQHLLTVGNRSIRQTVPDEAIRVRLIIELYRWARFENFS